MKSQNVRLLDILILGPLMIYAARGARLGELERAALAAAGIGTILYNWNNYLEIQESSPCCAACAESPGLPCPAEPDTVPSN